MVFKAMVLLQASRNEIEVDRLTLPILSIYRAGQTVEVLAGIAVEYGQYFSIHDVEHMIDIVVDN
jgi:hypothetical protein